MGKYARTLLPAALAFLGAAALYGYAGASLTSQTYRILISEMPSVGNTSAKTSGPYSLFGTTKALGNVVMSGASYSVTGGILNAVRPAQLDVFSAHVFPNPCKASTGCNGVTFTRVTLNAVISIYSVSGEFVRKLVKTGNIDSIGWDLRNDAGAHVASGLYLFFIKAENSTKKGKILIVR